MNIRPVMPMSSGSNGTSSHFKSKIEGEVMTSWVQNPFIVCVTYQLKKKKSGQERSKVVEIEK